MQDLKTLRDSGANIQREKAKLSPELTIQESVWLFFALYQTFASQLEETEAIFGPERRAHLIELQERLQRLAEWQQTNAREFTPKRHSTPKTAE
jgi:hypothetical protein